MKPEQQRIKIAEACGWKSCGCGNEGCTLLEMPDSTKRDPLMDLNAMHEAEKVLLAGVKCTDDVVAGTPSGDYFMRLSDVTERDDHMMFTATAAQRAEAFLKTLNLWIDD